MEKETVTVTIKDEIRNFLIERKSRNLSDRTIEFYRDILTVFSNRCSKENINAVPEITATFLRQYIIELGETHNPGGVHAHFRCIRSFLNWYEVETDATIPNPVRKVKPPKLNSKPIQGVPIADVHSMLITCGHDFLGLRDTAILRALIDTGARVSEFCNLRIMDLNMDTGAVKIIAGKGNKDRVVFVSPTTRRDIMRYLRHRQSRTGRDYLWVTREGSKLSTHGLTTMLLRRAKAAGVPVATPHDFRRTFALECLRNGMDLIQLMYLMGHTTTTVLQRYLALQEDDLKKIFDVKGPVW
jgi:integrase/recombinase XerC